MIEGHFLGLSAAGFHRVAYADWGDATSDRVVVCVHGLTRNGRDFDWLAEDLASIGYRVICPDMVGRGQSDWASKATVYGYPQYLADMTALIARLNVAEVDWVGTSMGGLIGLILAAQPQSPIRRLVINDIGPSVARAALERIGEYVGNDPIFEDKTALEAHIRQLYAGYGTLPDACWRQIAQYSTRIRADGRLGLAFDPAIGDSFKTTPVGGVDLWSAWDLIKCPVLVLRGANSDLLLPETAQAMAERGPKAQIIEIPDTAHAPSLMIHKQIALVRAFLQA